MEPIFRIAAAEDLPAVAQIYDEIHAAEEAGTVTTGWLRGVYPTAATAEAALQRGDLFVMEAQGAVRGAAVINRQQVDVYADAPWEHPAADDAVCVLHTLVISPTVGRCGLGRRFVAFYEDYARSLGCTELRIDTNARNAAARAMYAALGYREIAVVPTVFNGIPGVQLVLLEKHLHNYDVAALGELLIDFTQNGVSGQGNLLFEANPGGAPANVLAMLRRLGRRCAFLGKVGADAFGDALAAAVGETGVDLRGLRRDGEVHTTLAVVHTLPGGDRDFSFYRRPGADIRLRPDELDDGVLRACRVFHFGSLSLTDEPARSATVEAIKRARACGARVSFDPNLRPPLWTSPDAARAQIAWGLSQCDVLKIADNELEFMTGLVDFDAGAAALRAQYPNLRLLCVTAGAGGSYAYCGDARAFEPACTLGGVIETTGAGDCFCACMLDFVLDRGPDGLGEAALHELLRFANAAAYLVTTKKGAIRSMPTRAEVEAVLTRMV